MAKKSRRHKLEGKRPPQTPAANAFSPASSTHKPWQIAAVCLLLAVATIFAYRGVRSNDFLTYDDDVYVVDNAPIHQGITAQSIGWAFDTFQLPTGTRSPGSPTWSTGSSTAKIPPATISPMSASTPPTPSFFSSCSYS